MTRLLQFIPPIDIIEKVIEFLLVKAGANAEQRRTGENIVSALASVDIDNIWDNLQVTEIPKQVCQSAVDGAVSLGARFAQSYKMTVGARAQLDKFTKGAQSLHKIPLSKSWMSRCYSRFHLLSRLWWTHIGHCCGSEGVSATRSLPRTRTRRQTNCTPSRSIASS